MSAIGCRRLKFPAAIISMAASRDGPAVEDAPATDEPGSEQVALMIEAAPAVVISPARRFVNRCHAKWCQSRREQRRKPLREELVDLLQDALVTLLRFSFYMALLVGADAAAHAIGLLEGDYLASSVKASLLYLWTGVFATESSDLVAEAESYAYHMRLKPGMTICEMGSADGSLMALVGKHVMPGGRLIATSPVRAELAATAAAAAAAGLGKVQTYRATDREWAPGLPPHTCDAIYVSDGQSILLVLSALTLLPPRPNPFHPLPRPRRPDALSPFSSSLRRPARCRRAEW